MKEFVYLSKFREDIEYVESELYRIFNGRFPEKLYSASEHLINAGGKRIRPILVILSARAFDSEKSIGYISPIAIAVELIHTATLIHDDIIDDAEKRRKMETVNKKFGNELAILAGDLLFSKAFEFVGSHEINEISKIIGKACEQLAQGETLEIAHVGNTYITEEVYLEIIEKKTASLFRACAESGALLGGANKEQAKALGNFGYYLGISFQLVDDILDITGDEKLGKPIGKDIAQRKITLAMIHAMKKSEKGEKLRKMIEKGNTNNNALKDVFEILSDSGSIDYVFKRAEYFAKKAKSELGIVENSEAKKALLEICDSAVYREF